MARSAQRKRFAAWVKSKELDVKGSDDKAYKVWLHCTLEKESESKARKEILKDIRQELESLYE